MDFSCLSELNPDCPYHILLALSGLGRIGEIEIMVASKEEAPAAAQKIDDIAKELGKAVILAAIQR